jgi:cyanophycin synthetase
MSHTTLDASSRIIHEEAERMGIQCTLFQDKNLVLMEKNGKQWYTRGSRTSLQSSVGKTIADNKFLTKQILNHYQLPTAKGILIKKPADLAEPQQLQFPIVMKPVDEKHGKGVLVNVKTLEEATEIFNQNPRTLLCEEMLSGTEYRIVCVDFKFVAAAFRKPAHVVGDNTHSIQELIDEKNQHPWRGKGHVNNLSLIEVDDVVKNILKDQGLTLETIPIEGQEVILRKTANLSTGGEAWDVTDQVSEENRALFEKIAKVCDLNVIGIDMMCQSLEAPIVKQQQAGIIEVNASPGLRMHHFPLQGKPRNIAKIILEMVLAKI